jgi:hypothetical protein
MAVACLSATLWKSFLWWRFDCKYSSTIDDRLFGLVIISVGFF